MIDNSTKEQIKAQLSNFCENAGSANKAQVQLQVSGATISKMINGKHQDIADDMWRKMAAKLGMSLVEEWKHAETTPYRVFTWVFNDSQRYANVYGVTCEPGSGKTYTLDRYRTSYPNVFYAKCQRKSSESEMLINILSSMGKKASNRHVHYLLNEVLKVVERVETPVIIIDELEKVPPNTLFAVIDLYNLLEHKCGIVLLGTPNLKERVERGVRLGKMCFNELHSRIGGRFIEVPAPTTKDGAAVVLANGIANQLEINKILNDSHKEDGRAIDLRRVERLVHKEKISKEA